MWPAVWISAARSTSSRSLTSNELAVLSAALCNDVLGWQTI